MNTETPGNGVLVDLSTTLPLIDISCAANNPKQKRAKASVSIARIVEFKFEIVILKVFQSLWIREK